MTTWWLHAIGGLAIFCLGLYGLFAQRHMLRRVLALNYMGSGIFLCIVAIAVRGEGLPDPVPHALVLTGIVVSVSFTALLLALAVRLNAASGQTDLDASVDRSETLS